MIKLKLFAACGNINKKLQEVIDIDVIDCITMKSLFHNTLRSFINHKSEILSYDLDLTLKKVIISWLNLLETFINVHVTKLSLLTWKELAVEYIIYNYKPEYCRYIFLGGNVPIIKSQRLLTFPIGITGTNIDSMIEKLNTIILDIYSSTDVKNKSYLGGNKFSLDGYSSGVFIHEVFGHIAEFNIKKIPKEIRCTKKLNIYDCPVIEDLINYKTDDLDMNGNVINILKQGLNKNTGNYFCGRNNMQKIIFSIRQRNLVIEANTISYENKETERLKIFITRAGLSKDLKFCELIAIVENNVSILLRIPIEEIIDIECYQKKLTSIKYCTTCVKNNIPHYVGVKAVPVIVSLRKDITKYIIKRSFA